MEVGSKRADCNRRSERCLCKFRIRDGVRVCRTVEVQETGSARTRYWRRAKFWFRRGIRVGNRGAQSGKRPEFLILPQSSPESSQKREAACCPPPKARDLGDLFEYKLKDRVTIRKNQSALVPILQSRIDAEKVSVWNPSESSALRALWVNNTSDLTLDGGSFNVLEGEAFAGEGLMDPIKPGEKRILSYAADLGVLVDAKRKPRTSTSPR